MPESGPAGMSRRFGGLWRHPDFRRLWLAGAVSMFGSEVSALAIPLTAVLTLGAGPIGMGILAASRAAPSFLFGLFAGVWVDRLRRRPVLIGCDLARAAVLISIPVAWFAGLLSLAYLSMAAFLIGTFTVFFDVTHASYLPTVLRRDELVDGNSKIEISESLTQFAGPGIGGLLIQALSAPLAVAVDAISFVVSALFLGRIRTAEADVQQHGARPGMPAEAGQGLRFVLSHPVLRPLLAFAATTQLCMSAALAVYLLYAIEELGLPPAVVGLTFMAAAPGTILGALVAGRLVRRLDLGITMSLAAFLPGLGVLLMPWASAAPVLPAAVLMLAWFLLGLGAVYDIGEVSVRQASTPDRLRGRVNATRYFAFYGVMPVGALIGGLLGAILGIRSTLLVAGVGLILAPLWIVLTPVRRLSQPPPSGG
jgi:MFS family permease